MQQASEFIDLFGTQNIGRAKIDTSSSGNNTLVAAVAGYKIRVHNIVLVSAGTNSVKFQSGASGTDLTGDLNLTASTGFAPGFDPIGHFETAAGSLLNMVLTAAVSVDGWLTYSLVKAGA
jgi:hypothetical protein